MTRHSNGNAGPAWSLGGTGSPRAPPKGAGVGPLAARTGCPAVSASDSSSWNWRRLRSSSSPSDPSGSVSRAAQDDGVTNAIRALRSRISAARSFARPARRKASTEASRKCIARRALLAFPEKLRAARAQRCNFESERSGGKHQMPPGPPRYFTNTSSRKD